MREQMREYVRIMAGNTELLRAVRDREIREADTAKSIEMFAEAFRVAIRRLVRIPGWWSGRRPCLSGGGVVDLVHEAFQLQAFLESCQCKFCFIGGLSVQHWGEPRLRETSAFRRSQASVKKTNLSIGCRSHTSRE
jgi:hypothetical protein